MSSGMDIDTLSLTVEVVFEVFGHHGVSCASIDWYEN
jgi:hypothetical protein